MNVDEKIADLYRTYLGVRLADEASVRIRNAIDAELDTLGSPSHRPIMTIEEVADYLRSSVDEVEAYLGRIPCFEFAGRLRFRKEAVDTWIERRERAFTSDIIRHRAKDERKLVVL